MIHRLSMQDGSTLYKMRKQTVEPVFGIIKSAMSFRQFLLRDKGHGERRMSPGLPGLEFETHGRFAPQIRPVWVKMS